MQKNKNDCPKNVGHIESLEKFFFACEFIYMVMESFDIFYSLSTHFIIYGGERICHETDGWHLFLYFIFCSFLPIIFATELELKGFFIALDLGKTKRFFTSCFFNRLNFLPNSDHMDCDNIFFQKGRFFIVVSWSMRRKDDSFISIRQIDQFPREKKSNYFAQKNENTRLCATNIW